MRARVLKSMYPLQKSEAICSNVGQYRRKWSERASTHDDAAINLDCLAVRLGCEPLLPLRRILLESRHVLSELLVGFWSGAEERRDVLVHRSSPCWQRLGWRMRKGVDELRGREPGRLLADVRSVFVLGSKQNSHECPRLIRIPARVG